jgi:hypothetical protein
MARILRRVGFPRVLLVLATLVLIGLALIGARGAAAGPGVSTTTPFTFTGTNFCVVPAEEFVGSGNLHLLISDNLSGSGNVQFHIEANFSGLQAVTTAPVAGKKYVVVSQEDQTDTFDSDGMPAHETLEHTFQFVRSGENGTPLTTGDDFYEHLLAHITANANGTVTVNDFNVDTRCR